MAERALDRLESPGSWGEKKEKEDNKSPGVGGEPN